MIIPIKQLLMKFNPIIIVFIANRFHKWLRLINKHSNPIYNLSQIMMNEPFALAIKIIKSKLNKNNYINP